MSDLLTALDAAPGRGTGPSCARMLAQMSDAERAAFERAIERRVPRDTLLRILRDAGYAIGSDALRAHIRGTCGCHGG